jgi:Ca2+-binding RTX toxin-like protein
MASPTVTVIIERDDGEVREFTFTGVEDPNNPIVGSWYSSDPNDHVVITFLADGTFMLAGDGGAMPNSQDGMERGSYSWDPATGALTYAIITDTNGEGGLSHSSNNVVSISGDTATWTTANGGPFTLVRAVDAGNPLVGAWFGTGIGESNSTVVVTFLSNGEFFIAEDGDAMLDPMGQDGMERGTYNWDPSTRALTLATIVDTTGEWGPGDSVMTLILNTEPGENVEGGDGDDTLSGGDGDDLLAGGGGNDSLAGGAGNDALYGDAGDDALSGGEGDDLVDGGAGADTMTGGNGNDTYLVDDAGDLVVESDTSALANAQRDGPRTFDIGGGIDQVVASINYTLGNFVENLSLGGTTNLAGTGNALANELAGNSGNNVLTGGGGNDHITGGDGIDTATFSAARGQYTVSVGSPATQVDGSATSDGTDTLEEIERLQFADTKVALDLGGNAGEVAKILGAVFGADSVANENFVGIGLGVADTNMTYLALMDLALNYRLGAGASNTSVVELLYTNVVGAPPDTATRDNFVALLDNQTYTQGELGLLAADHALNTDQINLAGLAQTGLEYQ